MLKKLLYAVVCVMSSLGVAFAAININTASKEQLASLPNIGEGKAQAIIDYRKAKGGFKSLEELKEVKGIGDKTFDKLKSQITLSGESKPAMATRTAAPKDPAAKAAPAAAPAPAAVKK